MSQMYPSEKPQFSQMGDPRKRVCVIGGGPSGVTTVKQLTDVGMHVTCFEKTDRVGGLFGHAWPGAQMTSSTYATSWSDQQWDKEAKYWGALEYVEHIEDFVKHYKLEDKFQFNSSVTGVVYRGKLGKDGEQELSEDKKLWEVQVEREGKIKAEQFDYLVVCSGIHQAPRWPNPAGFQDFKENGGEVLHSSTYGYSDLKNKRVLLIGHGESASDISSFVSKDAAETRMSMRRKYLGYYTPRIDPVNGDLITDTDTARAHLGHPRPLAFLHVKSRWGFIDNYFGNIKGSKFHKMMAATNWNRSPFNTYGIKNCEGIFGSVIDRGMKLEAGVSKIVGKDVYFEDGNVFENVDTIICCTGYISKVPFLQDTFSCPTVVDSICHPLQLYKHVFVPELGEDMAVVGFFRPSFGNIPTISELAARWYSALISGNCKKLPIAKQMREMIVQDKCKHGQDFINQERCSVLVEYVSFMDELANEFGALPPTPLEALFKHRDIPLYTALMDSSRLITSYRLQGPGALPKHAREWFTKKDSFAPPDAHPLMLAYWFLYGITGFKLFYPESIVLRRDADSCRFYCKKVMKLVFVLGMLFMLYLLSGCVM